MGTNRFIGSSGHPDVCGPPSSAKISTIASTAGDFWFFKLWTQRKTALFPDAPIHALVAVTAKKQLFLKINYNLHPHSLNGESCLLEAWLRNHLSLFTPVLPRSRDVRHVPSPTPRR